MTNAATPPPEPKSARRLSAILREQGVVSRPPFRQQETQPPMRRSTEPTAWVDYVLANAIRTGASDLHLDPIPEGLLVRQRVDGILRRMDVVPEPLRQAFLSRIKVMAGMDIAIRRRPQDGGFAVRRGDATLGVRVSTLPLDGGEKAVLRILDGTRLPTTLEGVGLLPHDLTRVRGLMSRGQGALLVVGPTGSGKSSTLFGAIGEMDHVALNIITLEDPVENRIAGVNQVQVSPRAGLTFPSALRSVLRQDPDVIMVGEIRDTETAEIAMAAAVTGHLVLSSLHSADAPGAMIRLLQMGVPAYLVAGGLNGIIAQRLVRRRCDRCTSEAPGCAHCQDGYRGRVGVFEILTVDDGLREEIMKQQGLASLRRYLLAHGYQPMAEDARRKITMGWTTEEEVERILARHPGSPPRPYL